jgi:TonB family protein
VADRNGKVIEGLGPRDFAVTEDGKTQAVAILEFQDLGASPGLPNGVTSYYVLGYYTTNSRADGTYRNVTIALSTDATARLKYRAGYYAAPPDTPSVAVGAGVPDGVGTPRVIAKREPEYTEAARKAKYSGTVVLNVTVDTTGRISDIRVARPLGMGLDEKAVEAVQQWRFSPAIKDGKPVIAQAQVEVNFRIL